MHPRARRADREAEGARPAAARPRAQVRARQAAADAAAGRAPARAARPRQGRRRGADEEEFVAAPAAPDVAVVQQQFDLEVATLLFAPTRPSRRSIVSEARLRAPSATTARRSRELHEARARFVDELERGVDPSEAIENFIPRRDGGAPDRPNGDRRHRPQARRQLPRKVPGELISQATCPPRRDAALAGDRRHGAADAVARGAGETEVEAPRAGERSRQTVEDTVRRVAELDETTFDAPGAPRGGGCRSVPRGGGRELPAAAASSPSSTRRRVGGTWVAMPLGKRRKHYKKYTHVFDVEITPQIAESITTFGGTKLAAFLEGPARRRCSGPGACPPLPGDSRHDACADRAARASVSGLGRRRGRGAVQLHPLTPEAAGAAAAAAEARPRRARARFARPAAGSRSASASTTSRSPARGRHRRRAPAARVRRRSSEVNLTLDFPKDEFRVFVYLSEARRAGDRCADSQAATSPRRSCCAKRSTRRASRPRSAATSSAT